MLGAFKLLLRLALIPILYFSGIFIMIATIFKRVEWGLFLLIFLLPQPNLWYKFFDYPMGKDFLDLIFVSICIGMIIQRKGFAITSNAIIIVLFIVISYLALWNSSLRFSLPLPLSRSNPLISDWKNYIQMILLYFIGLNVIKNEKQQKFVLVLMSMIVLFISIRSYRNFSGGDAFNYDKRVGGPFEAVGLGANHFGSFIVDYCSVFLGLLLFEKDKRRKLLFLATILFGLHPLFFSYSRGAYLAAICSLIFFGLCKKRIILLLVFALFLSWQTLLPKSVVDRISMTETPEGEIEHSAGGRLLLWDLALNIFKENPIFGIGFSGYSMSSEGVNIANGETLAGNQDVHNYYMRTLCEQGVIGISILLFVLCKAFLSGWKLFKQGQVPFQNGLGLGFMGCVIAITITNMFGDRWSYFVLGGYFWLIWGFVDSAIINSKIVLEPEKVNLENYNGKYYKKS